MSILASIKAAIGSQRLSGFHQTLGLRLGLLFVLTVLPLGIFSVYQSSTVVNERRNSAAVALASTSITVLQPEIMILLRAEVALSALATSLSAALTPNGPDAEACAATARTAVTWSRGLLDFAAFADLSGRVICSSSPMTGELPELVARSESAPYSITLVPAGPASGAPAVLMMQPISDASGTAIGSAVAGMPQAQFGAMTDRPPLIGPTELSLSLFHADGTALRGSGILSERHWLFPRGHDLTDFAPTLQTTTFDATTAYGGTRHFAVIPLALKGQLFALASAPHRSGQSGRFDPLTSTIAIQILMALVGFLLAQLAAEWLVGRHVRSLHGAISAFSGGGRREIHTSRQAPLELRELADAIAVLMDTIQRDEAHREDELRQKIVLLRELNHRVKNNLQLITSMIRLQMRQASTPETVALLHGLQDRIGSLSAIEKAIYLTKDVHHISADELFQGILLRYRRADGAGRVIEFDTHIPPLHLEPHVATPLALFVTECITEMAKPRRTDAPAIRLQISLVRIGTTEAEMTIADDGPAAQTGDDGMPWHELSRRLLDAYARQLQGLILTDETLDQRRIKLRFPIDMPPGDDE